MPEKTVEQYPSLFEEVYANVIDWILIKIKTTKDVVGPIVPTATWRSLLVLCWLFGCSGNM